MTRFMVLALALAACSKVTDPDATDAATHDARTADAQPLGKPVAALTSAGVAGSSVQCTVATPATGGAGTIAYTASWTLNGVPFDQATTVSTTVANDTVPNALTHTGQVYACTLFAQAGSEAQVSDPVTVTMAPRLAYVIDSESQTAPTLDTLDLDTQTLTVIGPLGVTFAFGDIAWDAQEQKLYMVDGRAANDLYTIDVTTGAATLVGPDGVTDVFGLGFDNTHKLYAGVESATGSVQLVNEQTGAMTAIGNSQAISGLAFDTKRGEMVALAAFSGELSAVDLTTGAQTEIASPGQIEDCGLTYDPFMDLFWEVDGDGDAHVYRVDPADPTTPYSRTLVTTFATVNFNAIAIVLPPPP